MTETEQEKYLRQQRESAAKQQAQRQGRAVSYIDRDGCEVTAMPTGHVFYNVADWW